jgi:hypothetical protein
VRSLYTDIVLAACFFLAFGLRALIVGERFDRALHHVDSTYRSTREITRGVLVDPIKGLKDLPRAYGRYYGVMYRPVGDPEVERLRRRAVRAFVEFAVFGLGSFAATFGVGALLRRVSPSLHDPWVLLAAALLALYWTRRLMVELREPDKSAMVSLYMLAGIAGSLGAIVFIVAALSGLA